MTIKDYYPMPEWAVDQVVRSSGLVEDTCDHGVGHPNVDWLKTHDPTGQFAYGVHGCDGCCTNTYKQVKQFREENNNDHTSNDPE